MVGAWTALSSTDAVWLSHRTSEDDKVAAHPELAMGRGSRERHTVMERHAVRGLLGGEDEPMRMLT